MIENLSNSIMVPIAGVILAIVMTVDLIQMIADKNNLHDVDTWMIFKWVFKSAAAILIVTNTWNIVMGVFDMAQSVVAQAAGIINSDASGRNLPRIGQPLHKDHPVSGHQLSAFPKRR
ncbi:hypothetical protein CK3_14130 [butyrate-producing bacterium SS3/4]|nr:hypothetical protein CK3_14130 [butyrate-producing bacterium SS3/4]